MKDRGHRNPPFDQRGKRPPAGDFAAGGWPRGSRRPKMKQEWRAVKKNGRDSRFQQKQPHARFTPEGDYGPGRPRGKSGFEGPEKTVRAREDRRRDRAGWRGAPPPRAYPRPDEEYGRGRIGGSNHGGAHGKRQARAHEESRRRQTRPSDVRDDSRERYLYNRERGLPQPRDRDRRGRYGAAAHERGIVFGVEPIREMLAASPGAILKLWIRAGDERRFDAEIARVRGAGGQVIAADDGELQRMAGAAARHQGIIAAVREYRYAPLEQVLAERPDPLLIVDGVTDPRNLGALLRSAEGAGAGAAVLARDHTAGITPAAIKSSAGAWVHLKIAQCGNVARTLEKLKDGGYWIAALAPAGSQSIYSLDTARRLALVVGAEGGGVRELVRRTADFVVSIPMRGKVASLNVSVAAAIALYEIARRRERAEKSGTGDGGGG